MILTFRVNHSYAVPTRTDTLAYRKLEGFDFQKGFVSQSSIQLNFSLFREYFHVEMQIAEQTFTLKRQYIV